MIPQSQPKKVKNSSKVNLTISAVVHGLIILAMIYFAAREGYLGKKIQTITVTKVVEKKPEPEKSKEPEKPKVEPPKVEQPKVETARVAAPKMEAPPVVAPPIVAPAAVDVPSFEFGGGKTVLSESDPVQLYKGYVEYALRSKWNRPDNMADDNFVAEVLVNVDAQGNLSRPVWKKASGDNKWDQTVKDVFKIVTNIGRKPPTNFPSQVTIRFDVQEQTEPVLQ